MTDVMIILLRGQQFTIKVLCLELPAPRTMVAVRSAGSPRLYFNSELLSVFFCYINRSRSCGSLLAVCRVELSRLLQENKVGQTTLSTWTPIPNCLLLGHLHPGAKGCGCPRRKQSGLAENCQLSKNFSHRGQPGPI